MVFHPDSAQGGRHTDTLTNTTNSYITLRSKMARYALELSYPSSNSPSWISRHSPKSKQILTENERMTIDQTRASITPSISMPKTSSSSHQLNSSLRDGSDVEEILSDEVNPRKNIASNANLIILRQGEQST